MDKSPGPIRVVLVDPRNPLNIGAVARAMSNFDIADLRLVNPYDVAFREARSAINAHHVLEKAKVIGNITEAVGDCTLVVGTTAVGHRDLHVPLYRLETAGTLIREHTAHGTVALLFGSEKFGLSNEQMSYCHWLLRIPTREEHGSMNLGQAVAICLYELRRSIAHETSTFSPPRSAGADDYERFTMLLVDVLAHSGYVNERTARSTELKLRRLVKRLSMPAGDAETWLGIMRQILWKLRQGAPE